MLGSIAGDIIGSTYEFNNTKDYNFELFPRNSNFTDDSVLTCAVAEAILNSKEGELPDYRTNIVKFARKYPGRGYGGGFKRWLSSKDTDMPYNSFGNGSAMRVGPIGFVFDNLFDTQREAKRSAEVSHNHPEGIKGAMAVATAIYKAKQGSSKSMIGNYLRLHYDYDVYRKYEDVKKSYYFNETCQETVPEAIIAFLDSGNYEDAIRKAISMGGDSDTIGCIVGGIAQAYYKDIPEYIKNTAFTILDRDLQKIVSEFSYKYLGEKLNAPQRI